MEELKIILNEIVRDYGLKTLEDSQKFKAVFADYAKGEFTGEKELYMKIIEAGAAKEIMNSGNISATKDALVKKIPFLHFFGGLAMPVRTAKGPAKRSMCRHPAKKPTGKNTFLPAGRFFRFTAPACCQKT